MFKNLNGIIIQGLSDSLLPLLWQHMQCRTFCVGASVSLRQKVYKGDNVEKGKGWWRGTWENLAFITPRFEMCFLQGAGKNSIVEQKKLNVKHEQYKWIGLYVLDDLSGANLVWLGVVF